MRLPDALLRPSERGCDARGLQLGGGVCAASMEHAEGMAQGKSTPPTGTACGHGNGSIRERISEPWRDYCAHRERANVALKYLYPINRASGPALWSRFDCANVSRTGAAEESGPPMLDIG